MQQDSSQPSDGAFATIGADALASVVVFLVALPLCMGIAIASGVPVAAGLITGIVGGIVVGCFAGAPLQVSGPAAGLTVIVFELVSELGLEMLGLAVLVGGLLQMMAGVLRYGRWFRAVSPAVIRGMLGGIGVLIFSSQFHVMVDDDPKGSGLDNLLSIPQAIVKGLPFPELGTTAQRKNQKELLQKIGNLHEQQVQLRERVGESVPAPAHGSDPDLVDVEKIKFSSSQVAQKLAADQQEIADKLAKLVEQLQTEDVLAMVRDADALKSAVADVSAGMSQALTDLKESHAVRARRSQAVMQRSFEALLDELTNHDWAAKIGLFTIVVMVAWNTLIPKSLKLVPAPLVSVLLATIIATVFVLPVLYVEVPDNLLGEIHFPSLTILGSAPWAVVLQAGVVIGIVASAETLLCANAVDQMQTEVRTHYDKELTAQGVGNIICGLLGALPMTGVIVRSAANVEAGAKSRMSAIMHGIWLLVFGALLTFLLRLIPTSALAAMLVYTGYRLVDLQAIAKLRKHGWGEVVTYFVTLITIVCTDLLTGVIAGVVLSAGQLLYKFSHLAVELEVERNGNQATLKLDGAATFVRLPDLASKLEEVPDGINLAIEFDQLQHIDLACLDLLRSWVKRHRSTGGAVSLDWSSLPSDSATPIGEEEGEQGQHGH